MSDLDLDGVSNSSSIFSRDLRRDYEFYVKKQLDKINFNKIFDDLIEKQVICPNILEIMDLGYRWCCLKGYLQEIPVLKKFYENEKCQCGKCTCGNSFYDYLECITLIQYVVSKKSFSCLFI